MQLRQLKIQIDKKTSLSDLSYDDIDSLNLDVRTEQAIKHIKAMHEQNISNIAFCYNDFRKIHYRTFEELTPLEIQRKIYSRKSLHMGQSTFQGYNRSTTKAFSNSAIIIDIDYYGLDGFRFPWGITEPWRILKLMELDNLLTKPEPSYIYFSGNGINLVYLLDSIPVLHSHFGNIQRLRALLAHKLIKRFEDYASDMTSKDIARLNKVPGGINYKNNKVVKIHDYESIDWNNLKRYSLEDLSEYLNVERKKKIKKEKSKKEKKSKIKYLYNLYSLNINRCNDLEYLIKTRTNHYKQRELFLFIYALHFMKTHHDIGQLEKKIYELNDEFYKPLSSREIERAVMSKIEDSYMEYNYLNETLIHMFDIGEVEMENLQTIISKKIKNERDKKRKRRKRRNQNGLTDKQQEKQNRLKKVAKLLEKGMSQVKIADKLQVSRSTIKRDVKKIRELSKK